MRLRFSIRELLLVITVIGLTIGWLEDRQRLRNDKARIHAIATDGLNKVHNTAANLVEYIHTQPVPSLDYIAAKLMEHEDRCGEGLDALAKESHW
jgi:hypothetical protein